MCIGDFNRILDQSEKYGGRPYASSLNDAFCSFLNTHGLVDLGFSGSPFTWSNHIYGRHLIRERLDRGVASTQWIRLFPTFSIQHLPAHASDHNALLLNTATPNSNLPKPFRFEEFWTKDPSCADVISSAWSSTLLGRSSYILAQKLKTTKAALTVWNSIHFGNIQQRIHVLSCQLDALHRSPNYSNLCSEEMVIKKTLDNLYLQEEILWKNKSRETWLTCKDLNTRFFHVSTLIKKRRASVDFLKLPSGAWITDRSDIGNCFSSHFTSSLLQIHHAQMSSFLFLRTPSPLKIMLIFVPYHLSKKFSMLSLALALQRLQDLMDSQLSSTRSIGILSKMFLAVYRISS